MFKVSKTFGQVLGGILLIISGILFFYYIIPFILELSVKKQVSLEDGSSGFNIWKAPPPLDFKVYIFNLTNPNDVNNGSKPIVEEIGPYVYTERQVKEIIDYHDEDDTVSYNIRNTFHFNKEKSSPLNETDLVTLMNPAIMGTILTVENISPFALNLVNEVMASLYPDQKSIFSTVSVKDLLFDGLRMNCKNADGIGKMVCEVLINYKPITVRQDTNSIDYLFSFFNHKNDTVVGPYRVSRGRNDIKQIGLIKSYQGKPQLNNWPANSTCNAIRGTDATIYPPFLKTTDEIYIFVPDLCGSMFAEYNSTVKVGHFDTYKYVGSKTNFADPRKYPQNQCRCNVVENDNSDSSENKDKIVCPKEGVMFLEKCYYAPVQFSRPHFQDADPEYINYVIGIKPNNTGLETYVLLEPTTGTPVEAHKRLQINMHLHNISNVNILSSVSTGLMPLIWVDESFELTDNLKSKLTYFSYLEIGLKIFAIFIVTIGLIVLIYAAFYRSNVQSMLTLVSGNQKHSKMHNNVADTGACSTETLRVHKLESNNMYSMKES